MANNRIKRECSTLPFLFFLLLFSSAVKSQNISKHYKSSVEPKGVLYFILPQKGFENNKLNSEFTYDITYLTTNNVATLNFSYYDKAERIIDSVKFISGSQKFSANTRKIFVDTKKSKWHYRYSAECLYSDLCSFFNPENQAKIILYTGQGAVELSIKQKTWKKQSSTTAKILSLIKQNQ